MSNLLLSAGVRRFDPSGISDAVDRLESLFVRRIDFALPLNRFVLNERGEVYFDVPNKMVSVGGRTFINFGDAEVYSDKLREEGKDEGEYRIKPVAGDGERLVFTGRAKSQLLEFLDLPVRYANKQSKNNNADLIWDHANKLVARQSRSVLCRVVDNNVRAVLSTKYKPIDSLDILKQTMATLKGVGADVMEVRVWEDKFQMIAVNPNLQANLRQLLGDTPAGHNFKQLDESDVTNALLEIENDEAAGGGLNLMIGVYTAACTNYMLLRKPVVAIRHSGMDIKTTGIESFVISAQTRQKQAAADISKLNDAVGATFSQEKFDELMAKFRQAATDVIPEDKKEEAVKAAIYSSAIPKRELKPILESLLAGRDMTRYGLMQAVTRIPDAGRDASTAYACDRAGGDLLQLAGDFNSWIDKGAKAYDRGVEEDELDAVLI
jgi:hypothetical protein